MEYVLIGKIVSTHGIKGELKLISDFEFKDKVFIKNMNIYIGNNKQKEVINTYRHHKQYDMVTLNNYNNINEVLDFLKNNVYVLKSDIKLDNQECLDDDLLGLSIIVDNNVIGTITEVFKSSSTNKVIRFKNDNKTYLVPYVPTFVKNIDLDNKKMVLYSMEGVLECE